MTTIVTTSLKMNPRLVERANVIAKQLNIDYYPRNKQSTKKLLEKFEQVLVVYADKLTLERKDQAPFFFHPDTAMLRIKAKHDALRQLLGEDKLSILDCTMGLASDSIVMAADGHDVTALESEEMIHFIVSSGLAHFDSGNSNLNNAMRSITTIQSNYTDFLKNATSKSFDILYFDPMFSHNILESHNLDSLSQLANKSKFSEDTLIEAKRVARKAIIIKAHYKDLVFDKFGFEQQVRSNQKFHYGIIKL